MEILEPRQLLATVQWINPAGGSWDVAGNWSTDAVPGPGDDVVINVSAATPTVTISSNVESVNSITADDPLVISGGGLTVAAPSEINGSFTLSGGTLTTPAPLTLAGNTEWTGGWITGSGALTNTGTLTIDTNNTLQLAPCVNRLGNDRSSRFGDSAN